MIKNSKARLCDNDESAVIAPEGLVP